MKYPRSLPAPPTSLRSIGIELHLTLLAGVLLCVSPPLTAQSVTFAGAQTTLPASGLSFPNGVAVDSAGDVFIGDSGNNRVVELPRTATGYGPQTTLPFTGLNSPEGVAFDSAGDIFIADTLNNRVVELPWTPTGYGSQTALPFSGLNEPHFVALDSTGDVFITDTSNDRVVELPQTGTGYGTQIILPFSGLNSPMGIALDGAGDVFVSDSSNHRVVELPQTGTGYGPQVTLPFSGLSNPYGIALDSAGDVFITDTNGERALELPKTSTGYGQQTTLVASGLFQPEGDALDSAGDLFIAGNNNDNVVELQTQSVNFGGVNICPAGQTTASCSETLTLNFNVNADVTLGTPKVLTGGAPNLDFTLASGSSCTGAVTAESTCTVKATFAPLATGTRNGSVEITDGSGNVLATTLIYGFGQTPTLTAQSLTFTGTQTTLPFSGLNMPVEVALDSAGDVFVSDSVNNRVVGLPRTATGYGPQITLPVAVSGPTGITVDSAGDLFIADDTPNNYSGVEFPWTPTGYGPQIALPFSGLNQPAGLAVDSAGDLFLSDYGNGVAAELPKTGTGYGAQVALPFTSQFGQYSLRAIAVDSDKNVFLVDDDSDAVLELPWTGSGYGTQVTLPFSGLDYPWGVALDGAGDVFVSDWGNRRVVELPKSGTGYGSQVTLPFSGLDGNYGDAVDNDGNVFVVNYSGNNVVELQTISVNFGAVNICPAGESAASCSQTLTLNFNVNADVTLGTPKVLTGGAPNLDFTLASGSTCTGALSAGAACTVNVTFAPLATGRRNGSLEITDGSGNVLATTLIYGFGQMPTTIDFSQGFGQAQGELQFNGSASLAGTALELTNGGLNEASSAFYPSPVNVQAFTTDFTFQLTNPNADGFTFTIQNVGPGALGADGGSLGYAGIGQSVAVKFDLFQNHGDPSNNSTGIYIDGAVPIGPTSINLTGTGIYLHSGDPMRSHITYDGTTLNLTLTDLVTLATWSHAFAINIPATVGGDTAYVGFTGATGGETSIQQILTWSYQAGQPLYYPKGFSSGSTLSMNGSASLSGTSLQLTNGGTKEAGSAFYATPVNIQSFATDFNFKLTDAAADGFTFTIQNVGPNALGSDGGSLGYAGIGNSVAIKFDLFQNAGDPSNDSTGIFVDAAGPIGPTSIDLTGSGINLHSGDKMDANLTYDGSTLTLTITDLITQATWSHPFVVNIPAIVGGNTAYVGFTGATGGLTSTQQILNWTFE